MSKGQYTLTLILAFAAGMAGGMLSGKFMAMGPEWYQKDPRQGKVIVASEFHLVDSEGRDRWVLALSKAGEPNVTFINRGGWAPMAMGVNPDGLPYLNMVLEPSQKGGPSIVLMDSEMKARAILGLKKDGEPYLEMTDRHGRNRAVPGSGEREKGSAGSVYEHPASTFDGFVKSPSAALRFILRHCSVLSCTPHSS